MLGFIITMVLMMFALLIVIERRNPLRAGVYSVGVVVLTYVVFRLRAQDAAADGPFGF